MVDKAGAGGIGVSQRRRRPVRYSVSTRKPLRTSRIDGDCRAGLARVVRQNMPEFNGVIRVDNANAGEVSERPTVNALSGALGKGAVKVSLVNCSVLS